MNATNPKDKNVYRRKFPRRQFQRKIGILIGGKYYIFKSGEIGEGGMSFDSDLVFTNGNELVASFQIPGIGFVCLRAKVKSSRITNEVCTHGVSFSNIEFEQRRKIRNFVSMRLENEELII